MKRLDLLLLVGALLLAAGGWLVTPALGLAVAGAGCVAGWFLLDDGTTPPAGPA